MREFAAPQCLKLDCLRLKWPVVLSLLLASNVALVKSILAGATPALPPAASAPDVGIL